MIISAHLVWCSKHFLYLFLYFVCLHFLYLQWHSGASCIKLLFLHDFLSFFFFVIIHLFYRRACWHFHIIYCFTLMHWCHLNGAWHYFLLCLFCRMICRNWIFWIRITHLFVFYVGFCGVMFVNPESWRQNFNYKYLERILMLYIFLNPKVVIMHMNFIWGAKIRLVIF